MTIKYRDLMNEYKLTLMSAVLDPSFVSKAEDFEKKIEANQLSDDEIKAEDEELVKLFNELHSFSEEPSEDLKKAQHDKVVSEAKAEIAEATTLDDITFFENKFKDIPEVLPILEKKKKKFEEGAQRDATIQLINFAKKEITECAYDNLQAMGEKYKEYPELIEIIKKRHVDEEPANRKTSLSATLKSKKEWSYPELIALGITPTGNDMTIEGVKLGKEYLFNVYSVQK
jgi:hypothetical protein